MYAGCRDNSHVYEEVYVGCNVEIHVFKAYASIIYSESHTYAGFLRKQVYTSKNSFLGYFGNFQTLVSSRKF